MHWWIQSTGRMQMAPFNDVLRSVEEMGVRPAWWRTCEPQMVLVPFRLQGEQLAKMLNN
jgi:hypothetical protein